MAEASSSSLNTPDQQQTDRNNHAARSRNAHEAAAAATERPNSPLSLAAMRQLGYEMSDLTLKTREEVAASEREGIARVPPHRVQEYLDIKMKHNETQLKHRLAEIREARKNMSQDTSMSSLKRGEASSLMAGKEAIFEKEKQKLERMKERARKQVEFMIQEQELAEEIQRRGQAKQEKIEAMEKRKVEDAKLKALQVEEQRLIHEQKNREMEREKEEEQEKLLQRYESKQELTKQRLSHRQVENQQRKIKNEEIREKFEQRIALNRQQQLEHLHEIVRDYERKEEETQKKRLQFQEKVQEKFEVRREASEQKRIQIQDQLLLKQREQEVKRQQMLRNQMQKEQQMQQAKQIEDDRRQEEALKSIEKHGSVRQQFERTAAELQHKQSQTERALYEVLHRADDRRTQRIEEQQMKFLQHKMHIEEIQSAASRIEKQQQQQRDQIMQKILSDQQKMQAIQEEKQSLAKYKALVQAENNKQKQATLAQIAQLQQNKLSSLKNDNDHSRSFQSHNNHSSTQLRGNTPGTLAHDASMSSLTNRKSIGIPTKVNHTRSQSTHQSGAQQVHSQNGQNRQYQTEIVNVPPPQQQQIQDQNGNRQVDEQHHQSNQQNSGSVTSLPNVHSPKQQQQPTHQSTETYKKQEKKGQPSFSESGNAQKRYDSNGRAGIIRPYLAQQSKSHQILDLGKLKKTEQQLQPDSNNGSLTSRSSSFKIRATFTSPRGGNQAQQPHSSRSQMTYHGSVNGGVFSQKTAKAGGSNSKKSKKGIHSNKQVKELFSKAYVEDVRQVQKIVTQDIYLLLQKELLYYSMQRSSGFEGEHEQKKILDRVAAQLNQIYDKHEQNSHKFHNLYSCFH